MHKYRFDIFFRTETNIISLQIIYALVIIATVGIAFSLFYKNISRSLLHDIGVGSLLLNSATTSSAILVEFKAVQTKSLLEVGVVVVLATAAFGYLVARITLAPTRNALVSQKQFIGNIAHELRTPVSIIKTNSEVALFDQNMERGLKKIITSNIEELDRISDIINNLLSLNAFVTPEKIEFSNVDIGDVASIVVKKLSTLTDKKQLTMTIRKSEFRIVWGNRVALEQIVMNVLKNAISYTTIGGSIILTIEPNYRGYIDVLIQDSGIGIRRKDLFRIFEPFFRADRSRNKQSGGSGLGLAIVSELVRLHQGKIIVRSAPQRGTTVMISLPCGKTEKTEAPKIQESQDLGEVTVDFSHKNNGVDKAPVAIGNNQNRSR